VTEYMPPQELGVEQPAQFHHWYRPRNIIVGGAALLSFATGMYFIKKEQEAHEAEKARDNVALGYAAEEDGFSGAERIHRLSDNKMSINLAVTPNCTLNNIEASVRRLENGGLDITDYSFTAKAYPVVAEHQSGAHRRVQEVHGQSVTFRVANHTELLNNILGQKPCEALAGSLAVQQAIH
jgi:hypothetical protein